MRSRVTKRYVRTGLKKGIIVTVFRKRQRPIIYWINRAGFYNCRESGDDCEDAGGASAGLVERRESVGEERTDFSTERGAPEECSESEGDSVQNGKLTQSVGGSDEEGDRDGAEKGDKARTSSDKCVIDIGSGTFEEQFEQLRSTLERLSRIETLSEASEFATSCGVKLDPI